jgi:hypothetical protein
MSQHLSDHIFVARMPRPARPSSRRLAALLMTTCLAWWELPLLLQSEEARAQGGLASASSSAPDPGLLTVRAKANIQAAQNALAAHPDDEASVRNLLEALTRAGLDRDALAQADKFIKRGTASAALRAQRGYLRRGLGDAAGAAEDFAQALKSPQLPPDQRASLQAGLAEAETAQIQDELDRAQSDLAGGNFAAAADEARLVLANNPRSEAAIRIRVDARRELAASAKRWRMPINSRRASGQLPCCVPNAVSCGASSTIRTARRRILRPRSPATA